MATHRLADLLEEYAEMYVAEVVAEMNRGERADDYRLDTLLNWIESDRGDFERRLSEDGGAHAGKGLVCPPIFETIIEEARNLLRAGLRGAAIERLEKLARPKWGSEAECRKAYQMHMVVQRIASSPGATS